MSLIDRLTDWPRSAEVAKRVVVIRDDGFSIMRGSAEATHVNWASVVEIVAFKHDLFSIDEICLGFRVEGSDRFLWAGEEDQGFVGLRDDVEDCFEGILPSWFHQVAFPAFEENWTTIWRRGADHA